MEDVSLDKISPTGIVGLDGMLAGGLPAGRVFVIAGGPGSGKSILSCQFLYNGAKKYGEPGLLVMLDEEASYVRMDMAKIGLDLESLEKDGKLIILDLTAHTTMTPEEFRRVMHGISVPQLSIESVVSAIKEHIVKIDVKRIVVDGLTSLSIREADPAKNRQQIASLFKALRDMGCTTIVTSEGMGSGRYETEYFLSQGAIQLDSVIKDNALQNSIRILKLRGMNHDKQPRPFLFEKGGITVYPSEVAL